MMALIISCPYGDAQGQQQETELERHVHMATMKPQEQQEYERLVGMAKEGGKWKYQPKGGILDPNGPAAGLIRRTRVRGEGGDRKRKRMSSGQRGNFNPNGSSEKDETKEEIGAAK